MGIVCNPDLAHRKLAFIYKAPMVIPACAYGALNAFTGTYFRERTRAKRVVSHCASHPRPLDMQQRLCSDTDDCATQFGGS